MTAQNVSSSPLSPQSKHQKTVVPFVIGGILVFALSLGGYLFSTNQSLTILTPTPTQTVIQQNSDPNLNNNPSITPTLPIEINIYKRWTSLKDTQGPKMTVEYPQYYNSPNREANYLILTSPLDPLRGKDAVVKNNEYHENELKVEFTWFDNTKLKDTLDSFVEKERKIISRKVLNEDKMTIDDKEVVVWETEEGSTSGKIYFFITNNRKVIVQKYPAKTSRDNEFERIISSFKFI